MKAIILPGFLRSSHDAEAKALKTIFENKNYDVIVHDPNWKHNRMSDWVQDLYPIVSKYSPDVCLLGFSMGAMISLLTATKIKVDRLIACSPSGYLPEYKHLFQAEDFKIIDEHLLDFDDLSAVELFNNLQVRKGNVVAGEIELKQWPDFKKWTNDLSTKMDWPLTIVPNTGHEMGDKAYQDAITRIL